MNWLARLKKQNTPRPHPTETTETLFVVSVGTPDWHIKKIEGDAPAANDPAQDPDRWCWPHSTAMNTAEIDTFTSRLALFTDRRVILDDAERLADLLVIRDREQDDRRLCLECSNCQQGRCTRWLAAGLKQAQLPAGLATTLQRCGGFTPWT